MLAAKRSVASARAKADLKAHYSESTSMGYSVIVAILVVLIGVIFLVVSRFLMARKHHELAEEELAEYLEFKSRQPPSTPDSDLLTGYEDKPEADSSGSQLAKMSASNTDRRHCTRCGRRMDPDLTQCTACG